MAAELDLPRGSWFVQNALPYAADDLRIAVRVEETLYACRGEFGEVQVLATPFLGKVLVIEGIIQISSQTEFVYHEMIATLPCIRQGAPKRVLIVGGGDGGAAKHALRIATVERVVVVEIDELVLDVCRRYLPEIARGAFDDPRVELVVGDGRAFVGRCDERFDVIALDVTDPTDGAPSNGFESSGFLREASRLLAPGGVLMSHCGSVAVQSSKAREVGAAARAVFPHTTLHLALVPEFELTEFGFLACSAEREPLPDEIRERFDRLLLAPTRFLTPDTYASSRVLSPYVTELTGVVNL